MSRVVTWALGLLYILKIFSFLGPSFPTVMPMSMVCWLLFPKSVNLSSSLNHSSAWFKIIQFYQKINEVLGNPASSFSWPYLKIKMKPFSNRHICEYLPKNMFLGGLLFKNEVDSSQVLCAAKCFSTIEQNFEDSICIKTKDVWSLNVIKWCQPRNYISHSILLIIATFIEKLACFS